MLFSIVVPIYNAEEYLIKCINSILSQTYKDFELILVDDGSTDGSAGICDSFAQKDERINVIHQANEGHTKARLNGLNNATGKYVVFVDGDDWIDADYLSFSADLLSQQDYLDIICFNYYEERNKKSTEVFSNVSEGVFYNLKSQTTIVSSMLFDEKRKFFSFGIIPTLWSKIFLRDYILEFLKNTNYEISTGEDVFCCYLAIYNANKIFFCNQSFYHYRVNPTSISNSYKKDYFQKLLVLATDLDNQFPIEFESQVKVYKLYMFLGGITNECRGTKSVLQIAREIRRYRQCAHLADCFEDFNVKDIDLIRRVLVGLIRHGFELVVVLVLRLLRV